MIALLLDPEEGMVTHVDFDGSERSIAELLRHDEIDSETYLPTGTYIIRVYCDAKLIENSSTPGYVIEHTGGVVNHGKCLVVGIDRNGEIVDVPTVDISHVYVPGPGAKDLG